MRRMPFQLLIACNVNNNNNDGTELKTGHDQHTHTHRICSYYYSIDML